MDVKILFYLGFKYNDIRSSDCDNRSFGTYANLLGDIEL